MMLTLSLVLLLLHFSTKNEGGNSVLNAWQSLVELIYDFVLNLINEQIGGLFGNVKQKFFPHSYFSFLLPAGVPLPLALFLVLLELIPHCFRALSS
ncbi:hypothetical protein IC582_026523 [Cucumis melo]